METLIIVGLIAGMLLIIAGTILITAPQDRKKKRIGSWLLLAGIGIITVDSIWQIIAWQDYTF
jgi:hypothetical protein